MVKLLLLSLGIFQVKGLIDEQVVFNKNCYKVLGHTGENILLPSNNAINFVPDTMGIEIKMEEISTENEVRKRESKFYIRRVSDETCIKGFQVPDLRRSTSKIINVEIRAHWGSDFLIDYSKMIMTKETRPREEETVFFYPGETNILEFHLFFLPPPENFPQISNNDIIWAKKLTSINCNLPLCIRFFNHKNEYSFMPDINCKELPTLHRYNVLQIHAYSDPEMTNQISKQEHLSEIHQCDKKTEFPKMEIAVDRTIKGFQLNVKNGRDGGLFKMHLEKIGNQFYQKSAPEYIVNLFDIHIKVEEFATAWENRFSEFVLHPYKVDNKHCVICGVKDVELDLVEYDQKSYISRSFTWVKEEDFKIRHTLKASIEDEKWCKAY